MKRDIWNKCTWCGKFVSYNDFADGKATNVMVTPESHVTWETWEVTCKKCKEKEEAANAKNK